MGIPKAAKYILSSVIGWSKVVDMPNPPPRNIELIKNSYSQYLAYLCTIQVYDLLLHEPSRSRVRKSILLMRSA